MSAQSRGLGELLEGLMLKVFARMFVARPGKVERYDETKQQADVRPLFRETYVNADGEQTVEPPALISNVPVVFPGSQAGYLSFGLDVGDTVLLVYLDRSSDRWKSLGDEVDPIDVRRHHPSDAVAIVGLHAFNAPLPGVHRTNSVLSVKAGAQLLLGDSNATDGVAMASKVESELGKLWTALQAHTHGFNAPGTVLAPVGASGSAATVGSTTVKVKA